MKFLKAAAAASLFAIPAAPVSGYVVVLGKSPAHACYRAARDNRSDADALAQCNQVFQLGASKWDIVATFVNRGIVHNLRGSHDLAMSDFNAAIRLNPRQPEAALNKAITLLRSEGRSGEVMPLLEVALANRTSKPELAYFARAVAHEDRGDINAAYRDYRRAQELAPKWDLPAAELRRFAIRG